jgi:hypothetical protein
MAQPRDSLCSKHLRADGQRCVSPLSHMDRLREEMTPLHHRVALVTGGGQGVEFGRLIAAIVLCGCHGEMIHMDEDRSRELLRALPA